MLSLAEGLNQSLFIKQLKDFYNSKGTDDSFIILFKNSMELLQKL